MSKPKASSQPRSRRFVSCEAQLLVFSGVAMETELLFGRNISWSQNTWKYKLMLYLFLFASDHSLMGIIPVKVSTVG